MAPQPLPAPASTFHQCLRTPSPPQASPSTRNVPMRPLNEDEDDEDQTITPCRLSVPTRAAFPPAENQL